MKIRSDYVSNSSSASFVVRGHEAARTFYEEFAEFLNQYEPMGESMRVKVRVSEKDDWEYIDIKEFADSIKDGKCKWENVEVIDFDCDDYDTTGIMYLQLLYTYFEKLGFNPDDCDSERDFRLDTKCNSMASTLMKRIGELRNENKN